MSVTIYINHANKHFSIQISTLLSSFLFFWHHKNTIFLSHFLTHFFNSFFTSFFMYFFTLFLQHNSHYFFINFYYFFISYLFTKILIISTFHFDKKTLFFYTPQNTPFYRFLPFTPNFGPPKTSFWHLEPIFDPFFTSPPNIIMFWRGPGKLRNWTFSHFFTFFDVFYILSKTSLPGMWEKEGKTDPKTPRLPLFKPLMPI